MKKTATSSLSVLLCLGSGLFFMGFSVSGQDPVKESPALPDNISAIVTVSCVPCHTSTGGFLSRGKLNFTVWTSYSQKKQKEKAEKMYSELKKGAMPPKSARETRPEIIPTGEQIDSIKKWADSLVADDE
jgi:hypothetical protein